MQPDHHESAASAVQQAASAIGNVVSTTTFKLGASWSGALVGVLTDFPWAPLASFLAVVYTLHLLVGWWIDRLWPGLREQRKARRRNR